MSKNQKKHTIGSLVQLNTKLMLKMYYLKNEMLELEKEVINNIKQMDTISVNQKNTK